MKTVSDFKKHFYRIKGEKIDFRKQQYIQNTHGLSPCFDYLLAKEIIFEAYAFFDRKNGRNLTIDLDSLRISTLKNLLEQLAYAS